MIRLEYDRVVKFHPYRQGQPWENGGTKVLQVDGANGDRAWRDAVADQIRMLERELIQRASEDWIDAHADNHYGFTVVIEGIGGASDTYYQVRFSDGSVYIWLMPGPPEAVAP